MLQSQLCSQASLASPALRRWSDRLRPMWDPRGDDGREFMLHRKMWEWLFIAEALSERQLLGPGRSGLGFGVGKEPLVALLASTGCDLLATDQAADQAESTGWVATGTEYAGGLAGLNQDGLCPPDQFAQHVGYRDVDMNAIDDDLTGFDFTWSSCAFEHLGSLAAGADFVVNQMRCLKPGGVAVHTTEFTVSSNVGTIETGGTVLYRRRDIEALVRRLRRAGHRIDIDYTEGETPEDVHVDVPPLSNVHLRTMLGQYVTTSLALVIEKGTGPLRGDGGPGWPVGVAGPEAGREPRLGLSADRLARLDRVLTGFVTSGQVPGVVALVARRGHLHVHVSGHRTFAADSGELGRDTIFRIASMTKPVVAVAAMVLVEACVLRLDDPVDHWLPELAERRVLATPESALDDTVAAERSITVRDLLTFTLGTGIVLAPPGTVPLGDALADLELGQGPPQPQAGPEPDEWMRRLGSLPLQHQPGERWLYNLGSDILGVLVARASGRSLPEFLAERIFGPLGMTDTGFSVPPGALDRFVPCFWNDPATGEVVIYDPAAGGQWSRPPPFPSGGGGLVSTVDDYHAFASMLLNGGTGGPGGERIVSRPAVALMTADQLTPAQKAVSGLGPDMFAASGWGFGVSVVTTRTHLGPSVGSYGWNGGLGTLWDNDPAEALTLVLLTQRAWRSPVPPPICTDFRTLAYQAIDD